MSFCFDLGARAAHDIGRCAKRIGAAKSNTGEGWRRVPIASSRCRNGRFDAPAINQVLLGRFVRDDGLLVNSDMMQIQMASGCQPGAIGGTYWPGLTVDAVIAPSSSHSYASRRA